MTKGLDYIIEDVSHSTRDCNEIAGNYISIEFNDMTRTYDIFLTRERYNDCIGKTRVGKNLGMKNLEWDGTKSGVEKIRSELRNKFVSREEFRNFGGRQKRMKPERENYENYLEL